MGAPTVTKPVGKGINSIPKTKAIAFVCGGYDRVSVLVEALASIFPKV
jgi:hypothetical protein